MRLLYVELVLIDWDLDELGVSLALDWVMADLSQS